MTPFEAATAHIDAYVAQSMAALGTPGLALALTDRERTLAVRCYGLADLASGAAVAPETLFEIGSIGKTFTALALLQEADAGRMYLHRPLRASLPWFDLPSRYQPVTPHHLLCHTAGIPAGPDFTPEARYQVWALRELEAATPPGTRFHYSNLGYKALGLLIEQHVGQPYPQVIAERILRPLGMHASAPAITADIRPRLAVGYEPLHSDRPWHPSRPLVPAPFVPTATADGCIAATPGDMAAFARVLLGRGAAPGVRLLSEASFARMTSAGHRFGDDHAYCYGINVERADGHTLLWHPGGMPGFVAHLRCDMDDGLAAIALANGPAAPTAIATFALACLRAWLRGEELPAIPPPRDRTRVERAAEYAGRYTRRDDRPRTTDDGPPPASGEQRALTVVADGERLAVLCGGGRAALEPQGDDAFLALHPELDGFLLRFERDAEGRVAGLGHGLDEYVREGHAARVPAAHPPEWAAYPGRYRAHNPWAPSVAVALRSGGLRLLWTCDYDGAGGDEEPLVLLPDGSFRVGDDEGGPERVRFDTLVEGRALRLTLSGSPMYRD